MINHKKNLLLLYARNYSIHNRLHKLWEIIKHDHCLWTNRHTIYNISVHDIWIYRSLHCINTIGLLITPTVGYITGYTD